MKSVTDPKTCVNIHNHRCLRFIDNSTMRVHDVDPDVAVVQHYKRCHFTASQCQEMMKDTHTDDTILKYRAQLATAVSRKLGIVLGKT